MLSIRIINVEFCKHENNNNKIRNVVETAAAIGGRAVLLLLYPVWTPVYLARTVTNT